MLCSGRFKLDALVEKFRVAYIYSRGCCGPVDYMRKFYTDAICGLDAVFFSSEFKVFIINFSVYDGLSKSSQVSMIIRGKSKVNLKILLLGMNFL